MNLPANIMVKEVGPRDGLQNESSIISTEDKIKWINLLSQTGLRYIEISSFVHPKWIPQLNDAVEVANGINRDPGITYAALVPNKRGLERALSADIDEVSIFMSASESHNQKNINKSIRATYPVLREVVDEAKQENKTVRGYVSTVFGCPYEGEIKIEQVIRVCDALFSMGIDELSLGDTIGVANPLQVKKVLEELAQRFPTEKLAMHFHNTRGMALANVLVSLQMGITIFDGSLGGLGGCPYAKGASGNLATDDLIHMMESIGIKTDVNERKLQQAALFIQDALGKPLSSHQIEINSNQM
ncbi:hydroxymethylglutaryl-CoA lyase [Aquibacillus sp. 3ASR75-11]|uniref:Hydroxymethylglutaryl-CoA lyase n=1 Tax=Terrihalobacillus insolitus TaxID=2950438 RepID=A0A9X4APU8_9BACI|nr:hydroxymethylglutaryl-CoA lyase [Terrihalobacillus insolitus]MDC3415041.1 hydroxymethylglutaryl-CoA lyase [Terrihalobacillus insolitus]MDC3425905.1 hydroxymethylglutaryl-CoA lyase [Terrihalobacillus insolitus]